MLDPFVQKAFEKIKDANLAPVYLEQVNILEKHVAFLSDKLSFAEKEFAKAEGKLETALKSLDDLSSQLALYDGKACCIEIGPCLVKETRAGQRLEGAYCPHCQSLMTKGEYTSYELSYMCCKCQFELPAEAVESALAAFRE